MPILFSYFLSNPVKFKIESSPPPPKFNKLLPGDTLEFVVNLLILILLLSKFYYTIPVVFKCYPNLNDYLI